jgi:hypothetical protein
MIKASFIEGTTFYFVVPSDTSLHGNIIVSIEKNGSDYTISHACKTNESSPNCECEHTLLANNLIHKWNSENKNISIQYKREHVKLKPNLIQI